MKKLLLSTFALAGVAGCGYSPETTTIEGVEIDGPQTSGVLEVEGEELFSCSTEEGSYAGVFESVTTVYSTTMITTVTIGDEGGYDKEIRENRKSIGYESYNRVRDEELERAKKHCGLTPIAP